MSLLLCLYRSSHNGVLVHSWDSRVLLAQTQERPYPSCLSNRIHEKSKTINQIWTRMNIQAKWITCPISECYSVYKPFSCFSFSGLKFLYAYILSWCTPLAFILAQIGNMDRYDFSGLLLSLVQEPGYFNGHQIILM